MAMQKIVKLNLLIDFTFDNTASDDYEYQVI